MKQKYAFMLAMQSFEYEIHQLTEYAKECPDCFELLQAKLDALCGYMASDENEGLWRQWGNRDEIKQYGARLRCTSTEALCQLEKYQSARILEQKINMSDYISLLTASVRDELPLYSLDRRSKVLFIGSGAFPLSALTIAKETDAEILCLDTDEEATKLGRSVAETAGLHTNIHFSSSYAAGIAFMDQATHVIIASLVANKMEVLDLLKHRMGMDTRVIVRYGNGLKSLFNYPLETDSFHGWEITPVLQGNRMYDTLILRRKLTMYGKEGILN